MGEAGAAGGERLFELRRRTFDTPHFRGIEFIEVEAKSIINHVPGNYLPFNWTLNPYRGCSHACSYCMAGDTPVLMADGRTKPIAELEVGDAIYGTEVRGSCRRYVPTEVLAHWSTVKRAHRVLLEDGTELVASADHRFLSDRGWKHVTGAGEGDGRRPGLTSGTRLLGTGAFSPPPERDAGYREGYLCGLLGDGHVGPHRYRRPGSSVADPCRLRPALVDIEALRRAHAFLLEARTSTQEPVLSEAVGQHRGTTAIAPPMRGGGAAIRDLTGRPASTSLQWCKGFLAGVFDAEGGHGRGTLCIAATDASIAGPVEDCLRRLGFSFTVEKGDRAEGLFRARLHGGLREHLRFFHTVDPASTRKRTIEGRVLEPFSPRVVSIQPLGVDLPMYDITTGTGDFIANGVVSHNCFARVTHTYMDLDAGRDFETKIFVKVNAPTLLRRELRSKRWKGEHIAMGTATDPYQRAEGRYRIMPGIIETLAEVRNPFSILTKGTLILRDLDLLVHAAGGTQVSTALSVGTLDEDVWRRSEPGTPHPRKRIEAVARLNGAGIPCGVMIAPVLPGISDGKEQLKEVIVAALDAGATHVSPILLHLRPGVKDVYTAWLQDNYPDLVARYGDMYGRTAYGPKEERESLSRAVTEIVGAHGGTRRAPRARNAPPRWRSPARTATAALEGRQLKLL
jgi:DNA repair photolyase